MAIKVTIEMDLMDLNLGGQTERRLELLDELDLISEVEDYINDIYEERTAPYEYELKDLIGYDSYIISLIDDAMDELD